MVGKNGFKCVTSYYFVSQLGEKRCWTKDFYEMQLKANFEISKTVLILDQKLPPVC